MYVQQDCEIYHASEYTHDRFSSTTNMTTFKHHVLQYNSTLSKHNATIMLHNVSVYYKISYSYTKSVYNI